MPVKIFTGYLIDVEKKMSKWMDENVNSIHPEPKLYTSQMISQDDTQTEYFVVLHYFVKLN
jgi:hypothetical protein